VQGGSKHKSSISLKATCLPSEEYGILCSEKLKHQDDKSVNLRIDSMSILRTILAQMSAFITYEAIGKFSTS